METNAIYHGEPCNAETAHEDMQELGYSHKITYPNGVEFHVKKDEMTRTFFVWWQFDDDGVELTAVFPDNLELPYKGEPFCTMYVRLGGHTGGSIREAASMPLANAEDTRQMIHTLTRGCYDYNLILMTEDGVEALR